MTITFIILLAYLLIGELIARLFELPIPGSVIGMGLLFVSLIIKGRIPDSLRTGTSAFLQHLSLLFIPAGVGLIIHLDRVKHEWLPILAALILSTAIGLAVTGICLHLMLRKKTRDTSTH